MPGIRFASRFGSLQVSAIGYNNSESLYVMSAPIISRGICVIALAAFGLAAEGMQATFGREECSSRRREVSAARFGSLNGAKGSLLCGDRVVKAFLAFRTGGGPIYWLRLDTCQAYASSDDNILESVAASLKLIPWE